MTKTKSEEKARSYSHPPKPVLMRDPVDGTRMPAPKGAPTLMSTTYADCMPSSVASSASTPELVRQKSDCTVKGRSKRVAPETDEGDCEDWISRAVLDVTVSLRYDRPLKYYQRYIKAPEGQEWQLLPARSFPIHCLHPHTGFFFYAAPLEAMGVRIPFTEFQKEVLDHLFVAPSQLAPNAWGFLRGFEIVMKFLGKEAMSKVFFCFFFVLRSPKKDPELEERRQGAIAFRANNARSLFIPANDSNREYKDQFFFVRAANQAGKAEIGDFQDGELLRPFFWRSWCLKHFRRGKHDLPNSQYATDLPRLRPSKRETFDLLNVWCTRMMAAGEKFDCQFLTCCAGLLEPM